MPDKKLTDSEIIKALKTLLELVLVEGCLQRAKTISLALDLINRLQAENKSQSIMIKMLKGSIEDYKNSYINQKAENERLLQELQYPQADTVQPMSEENIVHCKECKHLMFSDFEGECSKGYKGIVRPNDSCPFGVRERGESK